MKKQKGRNASLEMEKSQKNGSQSQALKNSSNGEHSSTESGKKDEGVKDSPLVSKALGYLLRTLLLDLPLIALFIFVVSTYTFQHVMHEYLVPQFELLRADNFDYTYYHRVCTEKDISTKNSFDLIAKDAQDAVEKTLTHGASVHPNLLSNETAHELREFIVEQNKIRKTLALTFHPENRSSYGFSPREHPILAKALNEILTHRGFRPAIEAIAGKDPAIAECSHITSMYGALEQEFHQDVNQDLSASSYARNAVPSYSLFVPLQDTTKEMGSTGICPGTHMCMDGDCLACREHGYQVFHDSEVWPLGWGFLYNSAMVHRGAAHTDPKGQDRVLLLLTFLSRPRYGKDTLETRYISDHYFNRWISWGHTASDFAEPGKHMSQPWLTLRSLGIFKWPGRKWGWDFVSLLLFYIAHFENKGSAGEGELAESIEDSWIPRLPAFLQVEVPEYDDNMGEDWAQYMDALLAKWRGALIAVYLASFCVHSLILVLVNGKSAMKHSFGRLVLYCGLVLGTVWLLLHQASTSTWAKNIKSGRLYRTPLNSRGPELPSTLPFLNDVLTPDDFQSDYLDSFNRILDYGHAGNRQWNKMLKGHSVGYNKLQSRLQEQLSSNLVLWARQQQRRILTKNHLNQWAELNEDRARRFAHKELMKASNPFVEHAVRWTEFLLSETKYGYWRDTAMHFSLIPSLLRDLQGKLLQVPSNNKSKVSPSNVAVNVVSGKAFSVLSSLPVLPNRAALSAVSVSERSNIPAEPPIVEPYPGAWLRVGEIVEARNKRSTGEQIPGDLVGEDVIEGMYAEQTNQWFRGRITAAHLESMKWDVVYSENGETGRGLCHRCVRPFAPFTMNETVRYNGDARIIGIDEAAELYDLELLDTNEIRRDVHINALHRSKTDRYVYKKGRHARAKRGERSVGVLVLDVYENRTFKVGSGDGLTGIVNISQLQPHLTWYEEYMSD